MFKRLLPVILVLASPAWAGITYYVGSSGPTGQTAFTADASTRGLVLGGLLDFTGKSLGSTISDVGLLGITFSVNPGFIDVSGGSATYSAANSGDSLRIDLPSNVYAIGLFLSRPTSIINSTLSYAGGSFSLPLDEPIFFGLISETPLASISPIFLTPSGGMTIRNFLVGTEGSIPPDPSEAPEASSMVLMGGSLLALAFMARRKKRNPLVTAVQ